MRTGADGPTETPDRDGGGPRRAELLGAAARLFEEQGYHAVTIGSIGASVGISGPAIYRHFPSKEQLLVDAVREAVDRAAMIVSQAKQASSSAGQALELIIEQTVEVNLAFREFFAVYDREYHNLPTAERERIRAEIRNANTATAELLTEVRPDIAVEDAVFRTSSLGALMTAVDTTDVPLSRTALARRLRTMVQAALFATLPDDGISAPGSDRPHEGVDQRSWLSRREQVLATAAELFARHGRAAVKITEIAEQSCISGPGVYRYFPNKDTLFDAILVRAGERLMADVSAALRHPLSARQAVDALADAHVLVAREHPDLVSIFIRDGEGTRAELPGPSRGSYDDYMSTWLRIVLGCRPRLDPREGQTMVRGAVGLLSSPSNIRRADSERGRRTLRGMAVASLLES